MIRTFHSVGQGAFYTEEFDSFTMVYDCGGSTKSIIEGEIKGAFEQGDKINALFISHFHNDHVNGLKFLLGYCWVEKVYLPLLQKHAEIQLLIENKIYGNSDEFINDLIQSPASTIKQNSDNKDIQVIFVRAEDQQEVDNRPRDDDASIISSGNEISLDKKEEICEWVFVPYNFQYASLNSTLISQLTNDGINIGNIENELKVNEKGVINSYKKVLGGTKNFNINSLVLYSGPKELKCKSCIDAIYVGNLPDLWKQKTYFKPSCLYLGDYNVSDQHMMDDLKKAYTKYWNLLGSVQMPHHGSKYNYHSDLVRRNMLAVMSAGKENRYRHPHAVTVRDLLMHRAIPIIVTEDVDTKTIQQVRV